MGILDDLAMGFGLKERTADYDARTARNIAVSDATRNISNDFERMKVQTRLRNDPNFDYSNYTRVTPTGYNTGYSPSREFLDRSGAQGGYEAGAYTPAIVDDQRPLMQRMLFSPESDPSPNPYAIGPISMEQPLPSFGVMGLIKALAGGGKKKPLPSGAISALEAGTLKAPNKIARPLSILPADDGQITEEELADVTGEPTASNEFEGMNAMEIKEALLAKFEETGEDPTLAYSAEELFPNNESYVAYLNKRPIEDKITAYSNKLAGR